MKQKQLSHWLKVAVIGIALGFALQFVRAWTEPTTAPPGGNVGAPINTSDNPQIKSGKLNVQDVCLLDNSKCLSTTTAGSSSYTCGANGCESALGETCSNCPGDCGGCSTSLYCGDHSCNNGETCESCPGDCGACQVPIQYYQCMNFTSPPYDICDTNCFGQVQVNPTCRFCGPSSAEGCSSGQNCADVACSPI